MRRRIIAICALLPLLLAGVGLSTAMQPPVVTRYDVAMSLWPAGTPPLRVAFLSDTHVSDPDMPPARLEAIVAQVNSLRPDCVLLGGDYLSHEWLPSRYTDAEAIAPFAHLTPRIVTIAVLGNHDVAVDGRSTDLRRKLRRLGVQVPSGGITHCGPLSIGAVDDLEDNRSQLRQAAEIASGIKGPLALLLHKPSDFFRKRVRPFTLVIAGHTHCGQIRVPLLGPVFGSAGVPPQNACGRSEQAGRTLIVGGGVGTSHIPIRLLTRPEILLIRLHSPAVPTASMATWRERLMIAWDPPSVSHRRV